MPIYDLICSNGHEHINIAHSIHEGHPVCPLCGESTATLWRTYQSGIIADDFPGGVEIKHGLVNPDGSARKFYSKTEMKRAANEAGLKWADDSPGRPYKVRWSGRRNDSQEA